MARFLGVAFPFQKGLNGIPKAAVDAALVKSNLQQIIQTNQGERRMRPDFGANLISAVFENATLEETQSLVRDLIASAISQFEPRANVLAIEVSSRTTLSGTSLDILVKYEFNREVQAAQFTLGVAASQ